MPSAAIKCGEHPKWAMRVAPTGTCDICHEIWHLILMGAKIVRTG